MAINIGKQITQFKRNKRKLLRTIGDNGVKMFKLNNFEAQGFIDRGVKRWKPKKKKDGRKTLVGKTANLRNLIFFKAKRNKVEFGSNAISDKGFAYPKVHNAGLGRMPKRQFMGDSAALNKINGRAIEKMIKRTFG